MSPLLARPRSEVWLELARSAWLEIVIGVVLFTAATVVAIATISLSKDASARNDLRLTVLDSLYGGFVARQDDSAVVSLASMGSGLVDTLVVTGDTITLPSLRRGGFLRDRIETVNSRIVRTAHRNVWRTREGIVGPSSSFAIEGLAADGSIALGLVSSAPFVVLSPFLDREWRGVVASDFAQGAALVGLTGSIALERPAGSDSGRTASDFNSVGCLTRWLADARIRIYCTSHSASNTGRFPDVVYARSTAGIGTEGQVAPYEAGRGNRIWLNGRWYDGPAPIRSGDVLEFGRGPSLASQASEGVIASSQWLNGRTAFTTSASGFLARFAELGRDVRLQSRSDSLVRLSFHRQLTQDLERSLADFGRERTGFIDRMAVVVLDIRNGEVLAVAEIGGSASQPPLAFLPILPGSAVKPILYAAALAEDSTLDGFEVPHVPGRIESIAGAALASPMGNDDNGCPPVVSIPSAIQCSSNRAAAEVVVRALGGIPPGETSIPHDVIDRAPLVDGLATVFNVNTDAGRFQGRYRRVWLPEIAGGVGEVSSPSSAGLSPFEARPLITRSTARVSVDNLARYSIGAWENRWTLVALAAAYARIASGRSVDPTFWNLDPRALSLQLSDRARRGLPQVRTGLALVAQSGTGARLAGGGFLRSFPQGEQYRILAKTGTLNHGISGSTDTVYSKSLALVIGEPVGPAMSSELGCGVTVITHIAFRRDWRAATRSGTTRSLPNLHLDYALSKLARVIGNRWEQLGVCGQ